MRIMKFNQNQFTVEFEKGRKSLFQQDLSLEIEYQYFCKIRFKDVSNIKIAELILTENDVMSLLSLIYEYFEFNTTNMSISFHIDYKFDMYTFGIFKEYIDKIPRDYICIDKYNTISERLFELANITINYDDLMAFSYNLYYEFLDGLNYMVELYSPDFLF